MKYSTYVQSVPYWSKIKLPNEKIDNKEENKCRQWSTTYLGAIFQPNLTNEGFKERQGDPPFLPLMERGIQIL